MNEENITAIYELLLSALCSGGIVQRRYIKDALRLTFPPDPEGDLAYRAVLAAINEE